MEAKPKANPPVRPPHKPIQRNPLLLKPAAARVAPQISKPPQAPVNLQPTINIREEVVEQAQNMAPPQINYKRSKGAPIPIPRNTEPEYQANPYPDIEELIKHAPTQKPPLAAPQLPPPKFSKPGNAPAQKPADEVLDRKHFRDLAYQQIASIPTAPMPSVPTPLSQKEFISPSESELTKKSTDFKSTPGNENKQPRKIDYKPYTLEDYKGMRQQKYYKLGGLGADIGNDAWKVKRDKLDRMTEYAKGANSLNRGVRFAKKSAAPGTRVIPPEMEEAIRRKNKMKEYVKQIPKPRKHRTSENAVREGFDMGQDEEGGRGGVPLTELEKLEMQHNEYIEQIERLKRQF